MANRDWASLGWTPNLPFALPTERQLAQSLMPDSGKGAEFKFDPTDQNAALLAALGYGGDAFGSRPGSDGAPDTKVWSDDARNWLSQNGYNVGVAHDPNTSPGGRPEYFGLTGPDGQFVAGQSDPTMTVSDTLMDQITPFALMAAPFAAQALLGGGFGGAATGALAGAESGLTSLAAQGLSPAALGLTGGIAPAITAGELATLGAGIPGAVSGGAAAAGAAGGLATLGGGGSTVTALGSGMSPAALGITPVLPSVSAAEIAALGSGIPGLSELSSLVPDLPDLPDVPEYTPQSVPDIPNRTFPNIPDVPGLTPQTNWFQDLIKPIGSAIKPISDAVGGGGNLAGLIGGIAGAASGGGTETSSRDPWAAAQPFLKNILGDAEKQRANLAANPYTPQQQQQYQQAFSGLDQARSALPGLLNWGQGAMQRQSTTPSYAQLFGGGLLGQQPSGPTAQAGGAGGLLGGTQQDRLKALMVRGQGLIG